MGEVAEIQGERTWPGRDWLSSTCMNTELGRSGKRHRHYTEFLLALHASTIWESVNSKAQWNQGRK